MTPHHRVPRAELKPDCGGESERAERTENRVEPAAPQGGCGEDDLYDATRAGEEGDERPPRKSVRSSHQVLLDEDNDVGHGPTQGGNLIDECGQSRLEQEGTGEAGSEAWVRY